MNLHNHFQRLRSHSINVRKGMENSSQKSSVCLCLKPCCCTNSPPAWRWPCY